MVDLSERDELELLNFRALLVRRLRTAQSRPLRAMLIRNLHELKALTDEAVPHWATVASTGDALDVSVVKIIEAVRAALHAGLLASPMKYGPWLDKPAFFFRASDVERFVMNAPDAELRHAWSGFSDRTFKRYLAQRDLVLGEAEKSFAGKRVTRLVVLDLAAFEAFRLKAAEGVRDGLL